MRSHRVGVVLGDRHFRDCICHPRSVEAGCLYEREELLVGYPLLNLGSQMQVLGVADGAVLILMTTAQYDIVCYRSVMVIISQVSCHSLPPILLHHSLVRSACIIISGRDLTRVQSISLCD